MSLTRTEESMRWGPPKRGLREPIRAVLWKHFPLAVTRQIDAPTADLLVVVEAYLREAESAWDDGYQLGLRNGLELGRKAEREQRHGILGPHIGTGFPVAPSCPICGGTTGHVLGCPEMDKPR